MSDTRRTIWCGHCGQQTVFIIRAQGSQYGAVPDVNYKDGQDITEWRTLECQRCKKPTLEEVKISYEFVIDDVYGGMEAASVEPTILYPEPKTRLPLTNLPKTIEVAYLLALKQQDFDPAACAVMAGRTLEAVCTHENATGGDLKAKLINLADSGRISTTIAEMAHQLRQIRNLGAHDHEDRVTEEDVPIILDFLEVLLMYLYVVPAKIAAIHEKHKKTP